MSATSGRTLLAGSDARFVWASIADIYGISGKYLSVRIPLLLQDVVQLLRFSTFVLPSIGAPSRNSFTSHNIIDIIQTGMMNYFTIGRTGMGIEHRQFNCQQGYSEICLMNYGSQLGIFKGFQWKLSIARLALLIIRYSSIRVQ